MSALRRSLATLLRSSLHLLLCLLLLAAAAAPSAGAAAAATSVAVSPGVTAGGGESVTGPCPTFSWVLGGDGEPELRVYEVGESGEEPRVALELTLPSGASSWSPPRGECLELGSRYAWTVRAAGGEWAEPALFRVERPPSREEVARAIETLRRHLGARDDTEPESLRAAGPEVGVGPDRSDPGAGRTVQPAVRAGAAGVLRPMSAPTLSSPSLTLSGHLALGSESYVFKNGLPFLWEGGFGNSAFGLAALSSVSGVAAFNTAVGKKALRDTTGGPLATDGNKNSALGFEALLLNTIGSHNTGIGWWAIHENTTGDGNTALGSGALRNNSIGSDNTAVGSGALVGNTEGHRNVALGVSAGENASGAGRDDNIFIANTGVATDTGKIRIGAQGIQDATFIAGIHGATTGQTGGQAVLVDAGGQLGTASCGTTYVAATSCPAGNLDGPKCDRVPAGSYCEGDGECGISSSLNNCGTFDWYLRTE